MWWVYIRIICYFSSWPHWAGMWLVPRLAALGRWGLMVRKGHSVPLCQRSEGQSHSRRILLHRCIRPRNQLGVCLLERNTTICKYLTHWHCFCEALHDFINPGMTSDRWWLTQSGEVKSLGALGYLAATAASRASSSRWGGYWCPAHSLSGESSFKT